MNAPELTVYVHRHEATADNGPIAEVPVAVELDGIEYPVSEVKLNVNPREPVTATITLLVGRVSWLEREEPAI